MQSSLLLIAALSIGQPDALGSGDHKRTISVDELKRVHWIHVPPKYDPKKPAPVVLALHGATMDAKMMEGFTGLNKTADDNNFIVVYPTGTGPGGIFQTWNAGRFPGDLNKNNKADDVKYLGKVLDDVEGALKINRKRVYATGMSNGAMMSYRLASEMSDRIAAIAPVAGTIAVERYEPKRPVPVLHFHGTKDLLVPFNGHLKMKETPNFMRFLSVPDTMTLCIKANGCTETPTETEVDVKEDKLKVVCKAYNNGKEKSCVVLYVIENGGHTWPGSSLAPAFLGLSTKNFSANEVIWDFFRKYELK
jgi:polyhydroxybutyrate depolymerase